MPLHAFWKQPNFNQRSKSLSIERNPCTVTEYLFRLRRKQKRLVWM